MAPKIAPAPDLVIAVPHRPARLRRHDRGERRLAVFERRAGQIVPVAIEQVEGVKDESGGVAARQSVLQRGKAGRPVRGERDDLAIDQRGLDRQLCQARLASSGNLPVQSSRLRVLSRTSPRSMRASSR